MSKKVIINSGYFNPIHPGHIECMELSKALGDELIVIINNDHQAELKRGVPSFQDEQYRMQIVRALKPVDRVVLSIDTDGGVVQSLHDLIVELQTDPTVTQIIFAKGGDRFGSEVPEAELCKKMGVTLVDGIGLKTHNSSDYVPKKL
jgi:cytidyltransferase-like protein